MQVDSCLVTRADRRRVITLRASDSYAACRNILGADTGGSIGAVRARDASRLRTAQRLALDVLRAGNTFASADIGAVGCVASRGFAAASSPSARRDEPVARKRVTASKRDECMAMTFHDAAIS
jgi:hypothetical protein